VTWDLARLFSLYHQKVALWARHLGGPRIEVEDTVQEVFLVAQRRLHRFDREEELSTWLRRVTENVVKEQRREWRRHHGTSPRSDDPLQGAEQVAAPGPLQPEVIARQQAVHRVYAALDRMGERNRTAFILFEIEELSGQEIAVIKGVKIGTVWVWLHRARAEFARRLAELESHPEKPQ
jgi:RNA polymerase sigma-70 factor, ECF subfamily